MPRRPNSKCDRCGRVFYRRPSQKKRYGNCYCSWRCYRIVTRVSDKTCPVCDTDFQPKQKSQTYCSKSCASKGSKLVYKHGSLLKVPKTKTKIKIEVLEACFGSPLCCMVEGCSYSRTLDVHRLIPGRRDGEYVIGNMFSLCPNHHMEIERKIALPEKN
jgi:hypothetical protein